MRKGYLTSPVTLVIAAITLFVAIAFFINTYFAKTAKKQPLPTQSPSPTSQSRSPPGGTESWKQYTINQLKIEFRYPSNWKIRPSSDGEIELVNQSNDLVMLINVFDPSVVGITYCQAYPKDEPRCEQLKLGDTFVSIDWEFDNKANAVFANLNVVLYKTTPETKILFRQILSTFQFLD